jgi:hypothetical protein
MRPKQLEHLDDIQKKFSNANKNSTRDLETNENDEIEENIVSLIRIKNFKLTYNLLIN